MNMTREDILRELELLPIWTLNPTFAEQPLAQQNETTVPTQLVPIQPVAVLESESVSAIPTPEPTMAQAPEAEKISIPWLLFCPLNTIQDQDALMLLQNMVRAMQLASTDYQLIHEAEARAQYQPACTLLFGTQAAETLLGKPLQVNAHNLQPEEYMQRPCWVVHHPKVLLENPALKRDAWQIMCAAKAYMQQANVTN